MASRRYHHARSPFLLPDDDGDVHLSDTEGSESGGDEEDEGDDRRGNVHSAPPPPPIPRSKERKQQGEVEEVGRI